MTNSSIIQGLDAEEIETAADKTMVLNSAQNASDGQTIVSNTIEQVQDVVLDEKAYAPEEILNAGIDDISAMLMEDYSVTDVFRLCLEVMHRAFKFDHAVVCMVNNKKKLMEGKFGHGINNAFLNQFQFSLNYKPDIFHLALEKGIDIFIADTTDEKTLKKIPAWYQQIIEAESFIILPVMVKKKAIGLFYGDRFKSGELMIKPHELK